MATLYLVSLSYSGHVGYPTEAYRFLNLYVLVANVTHTYTVRWKYQISHCRKKFSERWVMQDWIIKWWIKIMTDFGSIFCNKLVLLPDTANCLLKWASVVTEHSFVEMKKANSSHILVFLNFFCINDNESFILFCNYDCSCNLCTQNLQR